MKTFYSDSYCFLHMYLSSLLCNKDHINSAKWWADWIECTSGAICICLRLGIIQNLLRQGSAPRNPALLGLIANRSEEGAASLALPLCSPAGSFVEGRKLLRSEVRPTCPPSFPLPRLYWLKCCSISVFWISWSVQHRWLLHSTPPLTSALLQDWLICQFTNWARADPVCAKKH